MAANYGVTQARGEYIARQDFDDRSYPERLRLQVEYLDAHPKVGVLGSHYVLVDENRGERYVRMPPEEHAAILATMAKGVPFANTLVAFRRQAWTEAGGYPLVPDLEDLLFFVEVARIGWQFASIPEALGEHFVHPASFFHRTFKYAERQRGLARAQSRAIRRARASELDVCVRGGSVCVRVLPYGAQARDAPRAGGLAGTGFLSDLALSDLADPFRPDTSRYSSSHRSTTRWRP